MSIGTKKIKRSVDIETDLAGPDVVSYRQNPQYKNIYKKWSLE